MNPQDTTGNPLPGDPQLSSSGGAPAVGNGAGTGSAEALTLEEINKHLGKQFPTKDLALKALSDTFSYVGKKKEDIANEIRSSMATDDKIAQLAQRLETSEKERFFERNPQYAEPAVRKLIEKIGGNPNETVNSEEFKMIFEKVSGFDKSVKLKTVLESNPRIVASRDSLKRAADLRNSTGQVTHEVQKLAVDAVKDAFGI